MRYVVLTLLVLLHLASAALADTDYRQRAYRAPTPDTVPGARRVDTAEVVERAGDGRTLLIDVEGAKIPWNDTFGQWLLGNDHRNIPGSIWLPNVGQGRLKPREECFLRDALGPDKSRPVLFYCAADCWLSWNAAKRAAEWGYQEVLWYGDGVDGWPDGLVAAEPRGLDAGGRCPAPRR